MNCVAPGQERGIYAASTRDVLGRWNNATPFAVRMMKQRERRAPGEPDAGNQHLVADLQRPDFLFGEGKSQSGYGSYILNSQPFRQQIENLVHFGRR